MIFAHCAPPPSAHQSFLFAFSIWIQEVRKCCFGKTLFVAYKYIFVNDNNPILHYDLKQHFIISDLVLLESWYKWCVHLNTDLERWKCSNVAKNSVALVLIPVRLDCLARATQAGHHRHSIAPDCSKGRRGSQKEEKEKDKNRNSRSHLLWQGLLRY